MSLATGNTIDRHGIYMDLFFAAVPHSAALERFCLAGYNIRPSGSYLRRFIRSTLALLATIRWCRQQDFLGKSFILREFSTWALLVLLPVVWRSRRTVGYNLNHNLVSSGSRTMIGVLARWIDFYYLSGTSERVGRMSRHIKVLDISAAYPRILPSDRTGPCVVVLARRSDQYELLPREQLREALASIGDLHWIGADGAEPPLSPEAYRELFAQAQCIVLAYHQGLTTIRHSGVIWDALLAGTPILCPATPSFIDQAGPACGGLLRTFADREELANELRAVLA